MKRNLHDEVETALIILDGLRKNYELAYSAKNYYSAAHIASEIGHTAAAISDLSNALGKTRHERKKA